MLAAALAIVLLQPAVGRLLVASPALNDPDFARAVILLIHYDQQAAIGLMLNRPTKIRLDEVFPEIVGRPDAVYAGGPVRLGVNTLVRANTPPPGGTLLAGGLYLIADKTAQRKSIASGQPSTVHVYVGYCGWSTRQLSGEIAAGRWQVKAADPALLFDGDPGSLWSRLSAR